MSESAQKDLVGKALQCIHLARTIRDRYADPTKIPGEDVKKIETLLRKAQELKSLAAVMRQQDDMESWGADPERVPEAIQLDNMVAAKVASPQWAEQQKARNVELFAKALRQGWKNQNWLDQLDKVEKANLVEDATGEVIVPHDVAGPIFKTLPHLGIFRGSGPTIRPTTSNKVDLRSLTGATAAWGKLEVLGATASDANVVASTPADVVEVHDLMAMSKVGVDELADTDANLVALITDIVSQKIAEMEDDAFAAGNGVSKPWGLAARATSAANQITQAVTAATNAVITADGMKALPYRVPSRFRQNGAYFVSSDAGEAVALLKDSTSNYLWQPSVRAGEPDTFSGKRLYVLEGLPSMSASTIVDPSVIFGDPGLGYLVADRQRITVQRLDERFAEVGLVAFIFKMRVGGDVMRPAAFAKYLL